MDSSIQLAGTGSRIWDSGLGCWSLVAVLAIIFIGIFLVHSWDRMRGKLNEGDDSGGWPVVVGGIILAVLLLQSCLSMIAK